ncbi:hypothetical protein D3C84_893340 [compost metagenome]
MSCLIIDPEAVVTLWKNPKRNFPGRDATLAARHQGGLDMGTNFFRKKPQNGVVLNGHLTKYMGYLRKLPHV